MLHLEDLGMNSISSIEFNFLDMRRIEGRSCDKSLVIGNRVRYAASTETEEKREIRSAGAARLAFVPLGLR